MADDREQAAEDVRVAARRLNEAIAKATQLHLPIDIEVRPMEIETVQAPSGIEDAWVTPPMVIVSVAGRS